MNTNAVNVAVVDGKTITEATELRSSPQGQPVRIKAVPNGKYILAEGDKGVAPENITIKRVGKDLHVALEGSDPDQPQLIIEGFFDAQGQLVGVAEDGAYHEYIASDADQDHEAAFLMDGVSSPQVLGAEQLGGFGDLVPGAGIGWFWPALLGLGALAVGGAVWASNRDDGDKHHDPIMPATPELGDVKDNVGDQTGTIKNGDVTDDTTPTFSGSGTPGNTIIVKDGDKVIGEVIVGSDGKWEFTPETPLGEGEHTIVIVEKDPAGNESAPSPGFEIIIDTVAPGQSVINDAVDDAGDERGVIIQNGVTDDSTPTLNGTAEAGSTVEVFANGEKLGSALVDADGNWTFTPDPALADGEYSFTTVAVDPAGNRGLPSLPYDLIIDTRGELIKIDHVLDDEGSITDELQHGGITDDTTPTLSGQATPNTQVNIYDNGVLIGTAPVDANGQWTFTPTTPLGEGQHGFTATVVTPAGGESAPTPVFDLEIDTTAPGKPGEGDNGGIDIVDDNVGLIRGPVSDGDATDDNTPTLGGSGQEPGGTVIIKDNGTIIGIVPVDENGNWEYTPDPALADGDHEFSVIVTDPAGNASEESDPYTVIIDTQAPAKPAIGSVVDDQGTATGPINAGDVTDDAQPEINGTAEPGSIVIIYDNGVEIGRAPVNDNGDWVFTPSPPLTNGAHDLSVIAQDPAGNLSEPSDSFNFDLVAGGAPTAPAITGAIDDVGNKRDNIAPGEVTDDARPTIVGTGEPGTTVSVYADGVLVGTGIVGENGQWSVPLTQDLPENLNNITATTTNAAGNVSPETGAYPIIVDTSAPTVSAHTLTDDVNPVAGEIRNNDTTDDSTPTISGTAEPGTTVIIYNNGVEIGRAPVNGDGDWRFTPATPLPDGAHSFSTIVEDAAGNQSPRSGETAFTVDTSLVIISIDQVLDNEGTITDPLSHGGVTDDTTPTLNGKATPNSVVNIYDNGVLIGTANSNGAGDWTFTPPNPLAEGDHSFTATVVTPAGGESAPTSPFDLEIDITAPGKPGEGDNGGIDEIKDDVGANQDPIPRDGVTDDSTPTLVGSGQEEGDTVTIMDNGVVIGTAVVKDDGSWEFTPNPPLNDGEHDFTIIVTDPAGNASEESDPYTVTIDTTAPTTTAVVESIGKDSGSNRNDFVTNDGSAGRLISGSLTAALAADEKVQVSMDGGTTWIDATLDGPDSWSVIDGSAHIADWEIQTRVVDKAGNAGVVSTQDVALDNTAPEAPSSVSRTGDDVTVGLTDTEAKAGDTVFVTVGGEQFSHELTQAEVDAGSVIVQVSTAATGAVETFLVDEAGNASDVRVDAGMSTETFESLPSTLRMAAGESISFQGLTLLNTSGSTILNSSAWTGSGSGLWLGFEAVAGVPNITDFVLAYPASSVSFDLGWTDSATANIVNYIDQNGGIIASVTLPVTGLGITNIPFTAPPGVLIARVEIHTEFGLNGIYIDNFTYERESGTSPQPANATITDPGEYFGTESNNEYSVADVGTLSAAGSGLHAEGGIDTLKLTGQNQVLNLTQLGEKISSVEVIDLTGTGNNTLNLSLGDVLQQGGSSLFTDDDHMQMMVNGNAGDVVNLDDLMADGSDPGNWANSGQVTVGGVVYEVYRHDALDAELLVQQGVQTNLV